MNRASLVILLLVLVLVLVGSRFAAPARAGGKAAALDSTITYLDSPRTIDLAECLAAWPGLEYAIAALAARDTARAATLLEQAAKAGPNRDGAMNLLAEVYRHRGERDRAWHTVGEAIRLAPTQHLHWFRRALLAFDQRAHARFVLSTWQWHLRTKEAYERALALAPRSLPCRYYVFYSYLNTPRIGGGDVHRALAIAQEGVHLGVRECVLFRADALLHLNQYPEAAADYDTSMAWGLFKKNLESFDAACRVAIGRGDWTHARRWCGYMVRCRPDLAGSYDRRGEFGLATGDTAAAVRDFRLALARTPVDPPASRALAELTRRGW
jgi:tetratricopeptide (TPR) repeat protein